MNVYETADGELYTQQALYSKSLRETRNGWDKQTQGKFEFNFGEWLIEAKMAGVIKERRLIG